jgi:molybdate transport system substrate-binding protein
VRTIGALLTLVAVMLAGCGSQASTDGRSTLRVVAAASLTESFTALEKAYEKDHPDVDVTLSLDSSAILGVQLSQGV